MKLLVAIGFAFTMLTGCQSDRTTRDNGFLLSRADATQISGEYRVGSVTLAFESRVVGDKVISQIGPKGGTAYTIFEQDNSNRPPGPATSTLVNAAVQQSLSGLTGLAGDATRASELTQAYSALATILNEGLPAELPLTLRSSLLTHPTILTSSLLHVDRQLVRAMSYSSEVSGSAYCEGCEPAPNDDSEDYYAEPTYQEFFPDEGSGGYSEYMLMYTRNSSCFGACGPGCDWCVRAFGGHICEMNAFCYLHDKHCGAWEHFFDCHW